MMGYFLIPGCYWLFPKVGFGDLGAVDYLGVSLCFAICLRSPFYFRSNLIYNYSFGSNIFLNRYCLHTAGSLYSCVTNFEYILFILT